MKDNGKSGGEGFEGKATTLADPRGGEKTAGKPKRKGRARGMTARRAGLPVGDVAALKAQQAAKQARKRDERDRADMTRGSALARLVVKGSITQEMFVVGVHMQQLWVAKDPGVAAMDFTRPKVDGGGPKSYGAARGGHYGAAKDLSRLILMSGMGIEAAAILRMVCLLDMMPKQVACELEPNDSLRAQGRCSREMIGHVGHQVRLGLELAWGIFSKQDTALEPLKNMQAWLTEHGPDAYAEQAAMKARAKQS